MKDWMLIFLVYLIGTITLTLSFLAYHTLDVRRIRAEEKNKYYEGTLLQECPQVNSNIKKI